MSWTEARIKLYLDGSFTRVLHDGEIITYNVDADFIPTHKPRPAGREKGYKTAFVKRWSAEEDIIFRCLRDRGVTRQEIARLLGRSEQSVKNRIEYYGRKVRNAAR